MYTVGADVIRIEAGKVIPAGATHATDLAGNTLCRDAKARFQFPLEQWAFDADLHLCPMCAAVAMERGTPQQPVDSAEPGVPVQPIASPQPVASPQPAASAQPIDWSESTELMAWSGDL
jgi:hypothetical protein